MVGFLGLLLSHCLKGLEDLGKVVHIDLVIDAAVEEQHLEGLETFLLQLPIFVEHQGLHSLSFGFGHGLPRVEAMAEQALAPLLFEVADFYLACSCLVFLLSVDHQLI